jgi:hypothetical protein
VLKEGTPAYEPGGRRIGVVEEVAADAALDIFDGLIIHSEPLPGHHLFATADQVDELHERGVLLAVDRDALARARAPGPSDDGDAPAESRLHGLLRRTWDRIGRR